MPYIIQFYLYAILCYSYIFNLLILLHLTLRFARRYSVRVSLMCSLINFLYAAHFARFQENSRFALLVADERRVSVPIFA